MKSTLKTAFLSTAPVMAGYLVLGIGFGVIMSSRGFSVLLSVGMSLFIYAGSMQYVAIGLFAANASLLTFALTTLMVNARHLFYGISMLDRYHNVGLRKSYLIFTLTDETYSLVCAPPSSLSHAQLPNYYLFVSLFDHAYWVLGSYVGAMAGAVLPFNSDGIEFALTALFITVFLNQWLSSKSHTSALIGMGASVLCLMVFGADSFLIPAMLIIALALSFYKEKAVTTYD